MTGRFQQCPGTLRPTKQGNGRRVEMRSPCGIFFQNMVWTVTRKNKETLLNKYLAIGNEQLLGYLNWNNLLNYMYVIM